MFVRLERAQAKGKPFLIIVKAAFPCLSRKVMPKALMSFAFYHLESTFQINGTFCCRPELVSNTIL